MEFFVTAPSGAAEYLAREMDLLGFTPWRITPSGVLLQGELEIAYRLCLWSRLANRVLLRLTNLLVYDDQELYQAVREIRWERHLHSAGSLAVDVTGQHRHLQHSRFVALRIKDAVVDRFREHFGERPSVDTERPDVRIHVQLRDDQVRLSIDLSGRSLHERGYRVQTGAAPLKENLAALMLVAADWPQLAAQGAPCVDPLCGSGTLLIEAALMAGDIAPGLQRDYFGFLGWKRHQPELWDALREEARQRALQGRERIPRLIGYDADPRMLDAARANLDRLGLADRVHLETRDLMAPWSLPVVGPGLLAVNPPFGERLGDAVALRTLYSRLGAILHQHLPGWTLSLLASNPDLVALLASQDRQPLAVFHGPIECRLHRFQVPRPVSASEFTPVSAGAAMLANRLRKNLKHLKRWAAREGVSCYRVYDADLPEYAVAIDLYQGSQRWVQVQEYAPPRSIDPQLAAERLHDVMQTVPALLEVAVPQVVLKVRQRQRGKAQYERLDSSQAFFTVEEAGCRLWVNLRDYLDTGLFLDHRLTRQLLGSWAKGQRFLNLFAYTGAATVHAAVGGALSSTSVDLSNTYLDWAKRNLELNGLAASRHRLLRADSREWLQGEVLRQPGGYDLIFVDPPTFSNSKNMAADFDVQRDHEPLLRMILRLLSPQGRLVFSCNYRRFQLAPTLSEDFWVEDLSARTLPEDFRRSPRIHQCWMLRHPASGD